MNIKNYMLNVCCICLCISAVPARIHAQGVSLEWVRQMGDSEEDKGISITTDSLGNSYTTGLFSGTADFDPGPGNTVLTSVGGSDVFVAKTDAAGELIWAKSIGGPDDDQGLAIAVDPLGNVYVCGTFQDTADLTPGTTMETFVSNGEADIFISKFAENGDQQWVKTIGGSSYDVPQAIAVDRNGNVFTAGRFNNAVDFDPGAASTILNSGGSNDGFLCRLDASGNFTWARQINGTGSDEPYSLALAPSGNIYITGTFSGIADFDPSPSLQSYLVVSGYADVFVTKLDTTGSLIWAKQMGATGAFCIGLGIAVDDAENVYTTGVYFGPADFDPDTATIYTLTSTNITDLFLCKLDSAGHFSWAKTSSGTLNSINYGYAVSTDASGNVYTTGIFSQTTNFYTGSNNDNLTPAGSNDIFISKVNTNGDLIWLKGLGGTGEDQGNSLHVDRSGNIYTTGYFSATADFDPASSMADLTSEGASDIFIHKMICSDTSSSHLEISACNSYILNNETYTASGIYTLILPNAAGCDSTITLDLTINEVNASIINNGFALSTTVAYSSYQWFLNGDIIPWATGSTYNVTQNGDYTVAVTSAEGCSDTSEVYTVNNVGIDELPDGSAGISIYPNPANDKVTVQAPSPVDVYLLTPDGRVIREIRNTLTFSIKDLAAGVYFLRITNKDGRFLKMEKLTRKE